jgi:DNA-binding HxlR family transcriptional regulator
VVVDNQGLEAAARRVGDRWSLRLIGALLDADRTFGELSSEVGGIAPTILTARLKALQAQGLVVAVPYERRPLRMRYSLTANGRSLAAALATLSAWGADREGHGSSASVHATCGARLETKTWCPTCERVVDDDTDQLIWC